MKICFDNTSYTTNSTVYYDIYAGMNGWSYNDGTSGCSDPWEGTTDRQQIFLFPEKAFLPYSLILLFSYSIFYQINYC
ncbi:MAG: hypothetical protein H8E57_05200 [Candidatus Cloacimonetes bacterium]|nr:hypothetical protein [Candidatus Cloacimonadota bacterium]